jgi:SAM-dependent methyltransferase
VTGTLAAGSAAEGRPSADGQLTAEQAAREYAAFEGVAVRAGWDLVDVLDRLGEGQSRRLLAARWDAERARPGPDLCSLRTGRHMPPETLQSYRSASNQARFRRTLDFVAPGERVFEIGLGRGYSAGLFLTAGAASAYHGIDLLDENVVATQEVLDLNDLGARAELVQRDLYMLDRAEVEAFGADLVVCCEVIEHVPDPERAVAVLGDALPDGVELLISVPLLGRLENVWGHAAIFTADRTRAMVEHAGLVVHDVSVVDNTWAFALCSREGAASSRAARAARAVADLPPARPSGEDEPPREFQAVDLAAADIGPSVWTKRVATQVVGYTADGLLCEFEAEQQEGSSPASSYGGVRIPATSPKGIRLELALDDIDAASAFYVDAMAGGRRVARWKWDPAMGRPQSEPATFVLRSGRRGRFFRSTTCDGIERADAFEVFVAITPGASVRFRVTQAAVIV